MTSSIFILSDASPEQLSLYFDACVNLPLLKREVEFDLAHKMVQGDLDAKIELLAPHFRMVNAVAARYGRYSLSRADLIQLHLCDSGEGRLFTYPQK